MIILSNRSSLAGHSRQQQQQQALETNSVVSLFSLNNKTCLLLQLETFGFHFLSFVISCQCPLFSLKTFCSEMHQRQSFLFFLCSPGMRMASEQAPETSGEASLQIKLSSSPIELMAQVQKATEVVQHREQTIEDLHSELSALKNRLGKNSSADLKKQFQEAEDSMKRIDEDLVSLKQLLQTIQKEMEELRGSLQDSKTSQRSLTSEESCKQETSHLKELLAEKEQQLSRVKRKRQRRTAAYVDTLHLLTCTQAALQQQEEKCAAVEAELVKIKAEQQQSPQQELQSKEGSIREEPMKSSEEELCDVCQSEDVKDEAVQLQVSCHLPEDLRWLKLKQAVFPFTVAEQ